MKLKKIEIDKAAYDQALGGRRCVLWDEEIPGFGLRIYPSGKKVFILSYRTSGRKHLFTLGSYGVLTLEQARREARIKLGEVAKGHDPLKAKRDLSKFGSLAELCEVYLEKHSKVHKKSSKEDVRRVQTYILPALKHVTLESLTVSDISQMHVKIGENSIYEANRTVELLRGIIEKGKIWGFLEPNAFNPAKAVKRFKEKKRDRWLTHEELPRVATAISEEPSVYIRGAIWLYLLTGVRKSELLKVKWSDVDLFRGEMRLENTKSGNDHYVPLSKPAIQLLAKLPRLENNPYIIPGAIEGRPLVNISKPWNRIRRKAGVADVRLHDLRRTVGSWLAQNGMSLHLIGKVLNHSSIETTRIYARFGQNTIRDALEDHGAKLLSLNDMGPAQNAETDAVQVILR